MYVCTCEQLITNYMWAEVYILKWPEDLPNPNCKINADFGPPLFIGNIRVYRCIYYYVVQNILSFKS